MQISSKFSVNPGKLPCWALCSSAVRWASWGLEDLPLLTLVFGFAPGLSRWDPRAALPLPGLGGRLHGDGSARLLLHLLVAHFRGEGCSGGRVSREVRACVFLQRRSFPPGDAFVPCFCCQAIARAFPSHHGRGRFAGARICAGA